ncbi:efflux transporter outer membrane subunit [Aquella oligotrophica]|uniref:TolC family protein n=1 Tax=Aquella oligotrophica TaxID=2067065 RepID=A0A2I7N6B3_9NEIS|nr:efflux transporter outer membrane subunit [Aquella oligotrophica]AUR51970.1 TolC family protein [Aquella oligotrophica]
MKLKQIALISSSIILSSCALLGPDYHEPQLNAPQAWSARDGNTAQSIESMPDMAWWQKFNDSQLNRLIESALVHNNNLQVAMGNLLQAQASLKKAQMGWVPTLSIGGTGFAGQYFNPGFQNNSSYPLLNSVSQNNPQNFDGYAFGAMPSYTLNVFSLIKQGEIAKLNVALQKQSVNAMRLAVISQVANSYFTLLGLHKQLELQQQMLADARDLRKYNQIQYRKGSIGQLNLEGLDQFISSLEAKIPEIEDSITQTENALQVLTNNNPGKIQMGNTFDNINTDGIIPVNLPSEVLKSRPDIAVAEYQLQVNNANIGAVTSQFFPTISLTGNVGQMTMQLSNLFNAGGDFWFGALGAAMPVFNLGLYADVDKAKGGYYAAYYNYIQTVRNAFSQVDNGLSKHDSLTKQYKIQEAGYQKAQNMYAIGQKQYKNGAISLANTVGFKLNIDYTKAGLNQLKIQQLNSIVNLYQVLGGGYNYESSLTTIKKFNDDHDIN